MLVGRNLSSVVLDSLTTIAAAKSRTDAICKDVEVLSSCVSYHIRYF